MQDVLPKLFYYVNDAVQKEAAQGELFKGSVAIPPILCVIDSEKAAMLDSSVAVRFLRKKGKTLAWGKSASDVTDEAEVAVRQAIGNKHVQYDIAVQEAQFIKAFHEAEERRHIARQSVTVYNLMQAFTEWVEAVGNELRSYDGGKVQSAADKDMAQLFYADLMSNGKKSVMGDLLVKLYRDGDTLVFHLNGKMYQVCGKPQCDAYWAKWDRPPRDCYRAPILARRDMLIPTDERIFHGDFYTPDLVVRKAYNKLEQILDEGWQEEYTVWNPCCGVGNLEAIHSYPQNVFMSTLEARDVNIMQVSHVCQVTVKFRYDYLNDDIADDGAIDYGMTDTLPAALRKALEEARAGGRKMLIPMNPPYAEAGSADNYIAETNTAKENIANTKV